MGFKVELKVQTPAEIAAGQAGSTDTSGSIDSESKRSFLERIKAAPKAISDAITGEGQDIEFPDVPGMASGMGSDEIGFIESIVPNLKMMAVRDDFGKAEVIEKTFENDPRWGGAFVDKFGLPMIMWMDKPYYVNKPGLDLQDTGTAIGEIIKFFPATKYANKAKNMLGVARRGILGYSATEAGSKVLEGQLAPEVAEAKKESGEVTPTSIRDDIAISTAIGVGADVALPPAARLAKKAIVGGAKAVTPTAVKNLFPRITPEIINDSRFIMSQGQRTSKPYDKRASADKQSQASDAITKEDVLRNTKLEGGGGETIQAFDARQLDQIRQEADMLRQRFGSGKLVTMDSDLVPYEAATGVQNIVTSEADRLKGVASSGYKTVRESVDQPVVTAQGMNQTVKRALETIDNIGLTARELEDYPKLIREKKYLLSLLKKTKNPKYKGEPFKVLSGYQKTINRLIREAPTTTEKKAFGDIKSVIDDSVFNGIEQGFITGNEQVIKTLFASKEAYRKYIGLTGKSTGNKKDAAVNGILNKITDPDLDPSSFVNSLFGHAKFNPSDQMAKVLKRYKANLPSEQYDEVIALIKDGVLEKAFAGNGKSGVTRLNIVNNYNDVFLKNKKMIDELFSEDELAKITSFRDDVIPTMWADPSLILNASGTSYPLLSAGRMAGVFSYMAGIPVVAAVTAADGASQSLMRTQSRGDALAAIRQHINRSNKPLLSIGGEIPFTGKRVDVDLLVPADASRAGQTLVREPVVEQDDIETSAAVSSLIQTLDPEARQKILQSIGAQ